MKVRSENRSASRVQSRQGWERDEAGVEGEGDIQRGEWGWGCEGAAVHRGRKEEFRVHCDGRGGV